LKRSTLLIAAALLAARCATAPAPPPAAAPQGDDRFLVDPRVGYAGPSTPQIDRRFDEAWRFFLAGDAATARQRFAAIESRNPNYAPASLAQAAIDISGANYESARPLVERHLQKSPDWTAARVYEAEIAARTQQTRLALTLYQKIASAPASPTAVRERIEQLEQRLFDELLAAARAERGAESAALLREALSINPGAREARLLLAQRLIASKSWDEARRALDPLLDTDPDNIDVQQALAEIDAGRGRFEEAIVRYERLVRRDPRFRARLDAVKAQWNAANMPPQFQRAMESESINRTDFAVLLYWLVPSVRFAQNLGAPPIAIDIDVAGRDELIRALALGVLNVDPVTRRVGPFSPVNAGSLTRLTARLLTVRGASCARQAPAGDASRILAACGVSDPSLSGADGAVSGKTAAAMMEQVNKALSR
jgi:tetratricopeptide (TPR) repeat protein